MFKITHTEPVLIRAVIEDEFTNQEGQPQKYMQILGEIGEGRDLELAKISIPRALWTAADDLKKLIGKRVEMALDVSANANRTLRLQYQGVRS